MAGRRWACPAHKELSIAVDSLWLTMRRPSCSAGECESYGRRRRLQAHAGACAPRRLTSAFLRRQRRDVLVCQTKTRERCLNRPERGEGRPNSGKGFRALIHLVVSCSGMIHWLFCRTAPTPAGCSTARCVIVPVTCAHSICCTISPAYLPPPTRVGVIISWPFAPPTFSLHDYEPHVRSTQFSRASCPRSVV